MQHKVLQPFTTSVGEFGYPIHYMHWPLREPTAPIGHNIRSLNAHEMSEIYFMLYSVKIDYTYTVDGAIIQRSTEMYAEEEPVNRIQRPPTFEIEGEDKKTAYTHALEVKYPAALRWSYRALNAEAFPSQEALEDAEAKQSKDKNFALPIVITDSYKDDTAILTFEDIEEMQLVGTQTISIDNFKKRTQTKDPETLHDIQKDGTYKKHYYGTYGDDQQEEPLELKLYINPEKASTGSILSASIRFTYFRQDQYAPQPQRPETT